MDDFLVDLFHLTGGAKRRPVEDFLSLCLGNLLARDEVFAATLLAAVRGLGTSEPAKRLTSWLAEPDGRTIAVASQVRAESGVEAHAGRVDLRLLLDGQTKVGIYVEAKVGGGTPDERAIRRYTAAFGADLPLALVVAGVPVASGLPWITWDDVADAVHASPAGRGRDVERRQVLALLAYAQVIDGRRGLEAAAWTRAVSAVDTFEKLRLKLAWILTWLGPNPAIREAIEADLEDDDRYVDAARGWGFGLLRRSAYTGSAIRGLALAVNAGDHRDSLHWSLEVFPSNEALRTKLQADDMPQWRQVRRRSGWFVTDLPPTRGTGTLQKAHLDAVLSSARVLLRKAHNGVDGAQWIAKGNGVPPNAGKKKSIPQLRAGILDFQPVETSLRNAAWDLVTQLAGPHRTVRGKSRGWGTRRDEQAIWARPSADLRSFQVALLQGEEPERAALAASLAAEPEEPEFGVKVEWIKEPRGVFGPCLTVALTEQNWRSQALVPVLARIVERALKELER